MLVFTSLRAFLHQHVPLVGSPGGCLRCTIGTLAFMPDLAYHCDRKTTTCRAVRRNPGTGSEGNDAKRLNERICRPWPARRGGIAGKSQPRCGNQPHPGGARSDSEGSCEAARCGPAQSVSASERSPERLLFRAPVAFPRAARPAGDHPGSTFSIAIESQITPGRSNSLTPRAQVAFLIRRFASRDARHPPSAGALCPLLARGRQSDRGEAASATLNARQTTHNGQRRSSG